MLAIVVFIAAGAFVFYVLVGYPLLLEVLSRCCLRPVHSKPIEKTVSVVIPVRNGERFLADKLRSILQQDYPRHLVDIVVVSDGSTDATDHIAREFAPHHVRLLRVVPNGKPAALNQAIPLTTGEILLLTDVRQVLAPDCLRLLVNTFADPQVGVASGNLVILQGAAKGEAGVGLYWRYEMWIRDRLARIDSTFGAVGPIYAIRRELAIALPTETLLDDVHLPLASFFRGYRLIVEPEAKAFDFPTTLQTEFGRKVRTLAGNYQILQYYPELFGRRNRMWFHFISYKFARLLLPYAMIALAVTTPFLPARWAVLAIAGQVCFYGAAAIDPLLPENSPPRLITSPIRTYVVLLIATVAALKIFFVSPRSLWKEATRIVG